MDKKVLLLLLPPIPSPHAAQHRAQLLYHSVWTRDTRWLHPSSPPPLPGHPSRQEVASKRAGRSQPLLHGLCPTKLQRSPAEPPGAAASPLAPSCGCLCFKPFWLPRTGLQHPHAVRQICFSPFRLCSQLFRPSGLPALLLASSAMQGEAAELLRASVKG